MVQLTKNQIHKPSVCILLATYNGENWLHEQLDSIFAQKDCHIEIFVNDDGSNDATIEIISQHPRSTDITVTNHANGGAGQNFLYLMKNTDISQFDYVAFCDQDDIWMEEKLSRAMQQMATHMADAYSSNVTAFWSDGERKLIVKSQPQRLYDYMFESAGPGCTFVFHKQTALAFQTFLQQCSIHKLSEVTLHDWLAYSWVRGTGRKWHIDDYSSLDYRQHDNNVLGASRNKTALKKRLQMVNDGWYFGLARLNAELIGHDNKPAKYLRHGGFFNLLHVLIHAPQLRRRRSEAFFATLLLVNDYIRLKKRPLK